MLKIVLSLSAIALIYGGCGSSGCCQGDIPVAESGKNVEKIAPEAVISSKSSECTEGGSITFDGRNSLDSDGHVVKYEWLFDGQATTNNPVATFSCDGAGAKKVCLKVTDNDGLSSSYVCQNFTVKAKEAVKKAPVARIEAPDFCTVGETIQADGTKSSDEDGEIVAYSWEFGDAKSNLDKPYLVCAKEGNQSICLDVTDNDGLTDRNCSVIVGQQVPNKPPVAKILAGKKECIVGEEVILDGSQSSDSDGFVAHFNWKPQGDDLARYPFACTTPGVHQICLSVVDDKGLQSQQVCEAISVSKPANKIPVAKIAGLPAECTVGEKVVADGTTSSDPDGNVTAYLWSLDTNATYSSEPKPQIVCDKEGVKEVCLTVTDNEGAQSLKTCQELTAKAPVVKLIPPVAKISIHMNENDSVRSFTADCVGSYDPDSVDSDHNPQNDGKVLSAVFTVSKTYTNGYTEDPHSGSCPKWISIPDDLAYITITLTVTDDDGQTTTKTEIYDWDGEKLTLRQ